MQFKKVIDLTHPLNLQIPTWGGSCGFCLDIKKDYDRLFRVQQIKMHAGVGTHIDAPSHRFQESHSISDIPLSDLIVPACVIDVSQKAHADYAISVEDVQYYESQYGKIPQRSLVIGYTGWEKYWNQPERYRNLDASGIMHFPTFAASAGELLYERGTVALAIDTLSPDAPDSTFPIHRLFLGSGRYLIENIAQAGSLPPQGAWIIALPIRAEEATEAPARIIALII